MTRRPRIGITTHSATLTATQTGEHGHQETRFEVGSRYAEIVAEAGGVPVFLPAHPAVKVPADELLVAVDGLLLSGGGSLSAGYFAARANPSLRDTNPPRYDAEIELARLAASTRMPLLGICRGHQTLVEALGGSVGNLPTAGRHDEHYQSEPPDCRTHGVTLVAGSRLYRLLGSEVRTNSFHRQAVTATPAGLWPTAMAEDGTIEAVEGDPHYEADGSEGPTAWFVVGCQFHPEWLAAEEPGFLTLFSEFIAAAAEFRSSAVTG